MRILDVGCGDGLLLSYLAGTLGAVCPGVTFEFYGFDVSDHGVQPEGYFQEAVGQLSRDHPNVPWAERLRLISQSDPWPWPAEYFDVILSNQVLEHVRDHGRFFGEIARTLRPDGFSAHLFPLRHVLIEPHLHLPLVHRVRGQVSLDRFLRILSWLGLGRFNRQRESLDSFAARHADYLRSNVNYMSTHEILKFASDQLLHADFRYTPQFYGAKLRRMLCRHPVVRYRPGAPTSGQALSTNILKYLASVTLVVFRVLRP